MSSLRYTSFLSFLYFLLKVYSIRHKTYHSPYFYRVQNTKSNQPRERYRLHSLSFSLTLSHPLSPLLLFRLFPSDFDSWQPFPVKSVERTTVENQQHWDFPFLTHAHRQSGSRLWKIVVSRRGGREKFDFFHFRSHNCVHFGSVFAGEKCEFGQVFRVQCEI